MTIRTKAEVMRDVGKGLPYRIVIQKKTVDKDDLGTQIEDWHDWQVTWAKIDRLWGREYYAAKAVNEESTLDFTIRQAKFVSDMNTIDYRIIYQGVAYDIKSIDYMRDGLWIKLKALSGDI